MTSVRHLLNPQTHMAWLTASRAVALLRLLAVCALLLAFAAGLSAAVSSSAFMTQAALHATHTIHAQIADGPALPCPGVSLPC